MTEIRKAVITMAKNNKKTFIPEWEVICEVWDDHREDNEGWWEANITSRMKVPGGWLVKVEIEKYYDKKTMAGKGKWHPEQSAYDKFGVEVNRPLAFANPVSMIFFPDPMYEWKLKYKITP